MLIVMGLCIGLDTVEWIARLLRRNSKLSHGKGDA